MMVSGHGRNPAGQAANFDCRLKALSSCLSPIKELMRMLGQFINSVIISYVWEIGAT